MLDTFILQQHNKLVKCQVGDLPSPEAFHTVYVQRFKSKCIKPFAEVGSEFPVPVKALPADFAIQYRQFPDRTPPIIRTFFLTRKAFIQYAELFQGLLKKLWTLYLFACRKCQICVLHSEVCAYALSCSGQWFGRSIISDDIKVVFTNGIAEDLHIADVTTPIAVLVKRKVSVIELQTLRGFVPFFERDAENPFVKFVSSPKLRRPHLMLCFELWRPHASATLSLRNPVKESLVSKMKMNNNSIKGIARYPRPMFLSPLEQFGKMRLQTIPACVFTIATVVSLFQTQEVVMDIAKVVKHITQAFVLRVITYLIFVGAHWILTCIVSLTPFKWVGRHATLRLRLNCLPTRYYYYRTFRGVCQVKYIDFFYITPGV